MDSLREVGRFLTATAGFIVVLWPAVTVGVLVVILGASLVIPGPSASFEAAYDSVWPAGMWGMTLLCSLPAAFLFTRRASSLKRFGLFVLAVFPVLLITAAVSYLVSGLAFSLAAPGLELVGMSRGLATALASLAVLLIAYAGDYVLVYPGLDAIRNET